MRNILVLALCIILNHNDCQLSVKFYMLQNLYVTEESNRMLNNFEQLIFNFVIIMLSYKP